MFIISFIMTITSVVWAAPVPDTGQTKCYDLAGLVIPCPSRGQALYGQDANYSINPMSYTKLDGSGNVLPDSAISWAMVKDNVTGLIWEMKTNLDGVENFSDPHDADNVYFRSNIDNTIVEAFLKELNDANFGGYTDWRLPTVNELTNIVNFSIPFPGPTIDTGYFPNTRASYFLSSTPKADGTGVWSVDFNGGSYYIDKYKYTYLRAVRGGQSGSFNAVGGGLSADASTVSGALIDNGDGTVTDTSTGLIWQQKTAGDATTLEQALLYCENLSLGGNTDWRLPTIKELRSLVDYSRYSPSINTIDFPDTLAYTYWSSTTNAYNTSHSWGVDFSVGDIRYGDSYTSKYSLFYMRAVRGGESWPLGDSILHVSPLSQNIINDAGTTSFSVSNTGTGTMLWAASVTSGGSWLSIISGDSGSNTGTILCSFAANTTMSRRTGTIHITAAGATGNPKDVTVTQESWGISAIPVPETGQTKCYDAVSAEIACPLPGQEFYGQDANYRIYPLSYTKLDSSGAALPDSATSWVMVKDNVTGLIWEVKTDDGTIHDKDNTYTWYDSNPATNGGYPGTHSEGADTEYFIKALNDADFGGYTDWRLPTIKEMAYIVNYGIPYPGPSIDTGYFPNIQNDSWYWSSTTNAYYTDSAWGLNFHSGYGGGSNKKYSKIYICAVRGEQSGLLDSVGDGLMAAASITGTYVDNGDGTISDASTGLMWQQGTSGNLMSSWEQALSYCENLELGGYMDWRLPTIKELYSLVDYNHYEPAIDTTYFPNTQSSLLYWSSTTYTAEDLAWSMSFKYGSGNGNFKTGSGSTQSDVRAVRGGGCLPDIKANGINGEITVMSGTTVSVVISLISGDKKGKLADWWFAINSPWGWYFMTNSGLNQIPTPLYQSMPLFDFSDQKMVVGQLPVGEYEFFFGVYLTPNDATNTPLYMDSVNLHVKYRLSEK